MVLHIEFHLIFSNSNSFVYTNEYLHTHTRKRGGYRTAATTIELFVTISNGFQSLTIVRKSLGDKAVLDSSLGNVF